MRSPLHLAPHPLPSSRRRECWRIKETSGKYRLYKKVVLLRSTFLRDLFEWMIEMVCLCSPPFKSDCFVLRNYVSDFIQSQKDVKLYFQIFFQ